MPTMVQFLVFTAQLVALHARAAGLCRVLEAAVIDAMIVLCFHDTEMSHYGYSSIGKQS